MVQIQLDGHPSLPGAGALSPDSHPAALAAQRLVGAGAIMSVPGPRPEQHLIGYLEWLGPQRLFWFTAYGESLADGHVLEFEAMRVVPERGICFAVDGQVVATLCPIEHAAVDDPDDYRIAWQLWQEVVPLRRALIEACCVAHSREPMLLDGVDGHGWPRAAAMTKPAKRRIAPNGR